MLDLDQWFMLIGHVNQVVDVLIGHVNQVIDVLIGHVNQVIDGLHQLDLGSQTQKEEVAK